MPPRARGLAILDVPDAATRAEAERVRSEAVGGEVYAERYDGLGHRYYSRAWFAARLAARGLEADIRPQCLEGYYIRRFRFNVFARRSGAA